MYNSHIGLAHAAELKAHLAHGLGVAAFFFVIYAGYALSMSMPIVLSMMLNLLTIVQRSTTVPRS